MSFQTEPDWLIWFVSATREAQLSKWPTATMQPEKSLVFLFLKTSEQVALARTTTWTVRCQMKRYTPAALGGTYLSAFFLLPPHMHRCCWVFHIPFSLLPPAWTPHDVLPESCAQPTMAERRSPSQKYVSWSSLRALFTLTRHSPCLQLLGMGSWWLPVLHCPSRLAAWAETSSAGAARPWPDSDPSQSWRSAGVEFPLQKCAGGRDTVSIPFCLNCRL